MSTFLRLANKQLTDFIFPGFVEDGQSYVFCGESHSDTNFILIRRHHQVVADDSWEDVRALARKRAEWGLTGVCMFAHTVYSFLLSYAVPARFVNKNPFFSLAPRSGRSDTFGHCRVKSCAFST